MTDPRIKKEISKIGGRTFLITSIIWFLLLLSLMLFIMYRSRHGFFETIEVFGGDFFMVIPFWAAIALPLTITNTVTKDILYRKGQKLIFLMPVLSGILSFGFLIFGSYLHRLICYQGGNCSDMYGLAYLVYGIPLSLIIFVVSIILCVIIARNHKTRNNDLEVI